MGTTGDDTRQLLREYYESTRRDDQYEPRWVHPFYEPVFDGSPLDEDHESVARTMRRGTVTHGSFLGLPRINDKDGWKVGTTTWIFMRRKACVPVPYRGWTIINATFHSEKFWMAYNDDHRVGLSTLSDASIGPCRSLDDVKDIINEGAPGGLLGAERPMFPGQLFRVEPSPNHGNDDESYRAFLLDLYSRHRRGDEFAAGATKDALAAEGFRWWPVGFRGGKTDDDAFGAVTTAYLPMSDEERPLDLRVVMRQVAAARWCDQGFPVVQMAHTYTAALMATRLSPDLATEVHAPWKAFLIQLPNQLLPLHIGSVVSYATMVLVWASENDEDGTAWNFWVFHDRGYLAYEGLKPAEVLADDLNEDMKQHPDAIRGGAEIDTEILNRVRLVVARLVLNACCVMTNDASRLKPLRRATPKRRLGRLRPEPPEYRCFELGEAVQVDCRGAVREFLTPGSRRAGTPPSVITLVCGHRKQQAHGPRHSLRKTIWIQPYWRGPDGAPIVMRPHVLGDRLAKAAPRDNESEEKSTAEKRGAS